MGDLLHGVDIGAACGDTLLAARALGLAEPDNDWSAISNKVVPNSENRGVYGELYGIYRRLYSAIQEQSHKLAQMQKGEGDVVA